MLSSNDCYGTTLLGLVNQVTQVGHRWEWLLALT